MTQQWGRVAQIIADARHPAGASEAEVAFRLLSAGCNLLPVSGASLSWVTEDGPGALLAATDGSARLLEELQFSLGEGPCVDSSRSGRPVLQGDLARTAGDRWPAFSAGALDAGIAAVFAFPMRAGQTKVGVLDFYRTTVGGLGAAEVDEALAFAAAATAVVLDLQLGLGDTRIHPLLVESMMDRAEVHRAAGMVSVQLAIRVADALTVLRARSYADDRPIIDIAQDVVERRLRFDQRFTK